MFHDTRTVTLNDIQTITSVVFHSRTYKVHSI